MQPELQAKPELENADDPLHVATAVMGPSITLLASHPHLKFLLVRDTAIEESGVLLKGVRLVEIPQGWRLQFIRLLSRFRHVCLPDEIEFASLRICAAVPESSDREFVYLDDMSRLVRLTGGEYLSLCEMEGRSLRKWVVDRFDI